MPSSAGYKRNYKQEYKVSQSSKKDKDDRAARNSNRAKMEKAGRVSKGDGKDVSHKRALSKGGSNSKSNLTVKSKGANRSFKRTKTAGMK